MSKSESQNPVDALLDRRLQELPREIAPERDLWPSIERDIQRPQRRLLPIAVAAGIAVISIALVLNFNPRPTEEKWAAVPPGDKSLGWMQQTAELQQMKVGLQPALEQQLSLLDPETRRVVLENLAIIEQARNNMWCWRTSPSSNRRATILLMLCRYAHKAQCSAISTFSFGNRKWRSIAGFPAIATRCNRRFSMNKLITFIALIIIPFALSAGESVSRSLEADPEGTVEVSVIRGKVKLQGWDQSMVKVEGTLDDHAEELIFERDGNQITLKVKIPRNMSDGKGSDLTIHVPLASELEVSGISTDFRVSGTKGAVELNTISGDLVLKGVDGPIDANSISGDVSIKKAAGQVEANTVSGDIKLEGSGKAYELTTVSGDVRLAGSLLSYLEGATVSGDIQIRTSLEPTAKIELDSVSGDISLVLSDDIHARFDLETGPGGDIRNELSEQKPVRAKYTGAEALSLKLGSGGGRVKMETFSGTLSLSR